ncbi:MAG TPA: type IV toxin-antitoxin system AbiEi family antitoxin domain-containing protein [Acidimicrobiales bacterium]|nr:type IV toxin-antitoxin system AbiEi family antitoxin domain-containing protein [Acidimicrobiales bacterium]
MQSTVTRELARRFRDQFGMITRAQLHAIGVSNDVIRRRLAAGEWEQLSRKTFRVASSSQQPEQHLFAVLLAVGPAAVASHQSAAWLWRIIDAPGRHAITVPRAISNRPRSCDVHRPTEFPTQIVTVRNIPCTAPLRTVIDLAAVVPPQVLEEAVDRALASKLVTLEAIEAELARSARKGRPGLTALRKAVSRRTLPGAGQPSVLESRVLRLLRQAAIRPLAAEVKAGPDLSYRVDVLVAPGLAVEVDGYAYHNGPEQMAEDARRRNRLHLSGVQTLVYTWRDVVYDGHRLVAEVRNALDRLSRSS